MKAIVRDLKRLCSKKHQLGKMVWPFSSSNAQPEVVEQERAGYECAPYSVLETAEDYQVFNVSAWLVKIVQNRFGDTHQQNGRL